MPVCSNFDLSWLASFMLIKMCRSAWPISLGHFDLQFSPSSLHGLTHLLFLAYSLNNIIVQEAIRAAKAVCATAGQFCSHETFAQLQNQSPVALLEQSANFLEVGAVTSIEKTRARRVPVLGSSFLAFARGRETGQKGPTREKEGGIEKLRAHVCECQRRPCFPTPPFLLSA